MTAEGRARSFVRAAGGPELLDRLDALDAHHRRPRAAPASPPRPVPGDGSDYDVAIVGGGLWMLLAPVLARLGLRVAIFERGRAGVAHREWNASAPELEALVKAGIVSRARLAELVVARYDHGICTFHGGSSYPVDGVLDHAVDAGALLRDARTLAETHGVTFFDRHELVAEAVGAQAVRLRFLAERGATRDVTATVMVDARGAASPYATSDLLCPTVGGVLTGLHEGDGPGEMNPRAGEILATIDGVHDGRQHVWEAFPGRPGETTVYLFYYARRAEPLSLAQLYERFFETLPRYKHGDAKLLRPTFGVIPGWSRLTPAPHPPNARTVLVGDAAARHSPLTYCGFGAMLRTLEHVADGVVVLAQDGERGADGPLRDEPIHALTGALAHVMASRSFKGDELNSLLDAAFGTLHAMGNDDYASLLRDTMPPAVFASFLRRMAGRHPSVWWKATRGLSATTGVRWGLGLARALVAKV
jgi:lycopene cyclase CruA